MRLPKFRALLLAGVIVALTAVVGYALQREFARPPASETGAVAAAVPQKALSAEEEAYAAALWPIHREVKLAAVGMSFAGIEYKTNGRQPDRLEAAVEPLADGFKEAIAKAEALAAPASLRPVHERYLGALVAYENAADAMLRTARDGRDQHLMEAQRMSLRASEETLRVGEVLWPGEYKPH
jgi:hypothetical protein